MLLSCILEIFDLNSIPINVCAGIYFTCSCIRLRASLSSAESRCADRNAFFSCDSFSLFFVLQLSHSATLDRNLQLIANTELSDSTITRHGRLLYNTKELGSISYHTAARASLLASNLALIVSSWARNWARNWASLVDSAGAFALYSSCSSGFNLGRA